MEICIRTDLHVVFHRWLDMETTFSHSPSIRPGAFTLLRQTIKCQVIIYYKHIECSVAQINTIQSTGGMLQLEVSS